jgi:hypothetical protein
LVAIARQAGKVIWNGSVGVLEFEAFHSGTQAIAHAVAACKGFTLAGGGDTIAAIEKFQEAEESGTPTKFPAEGPLFLGGDGSESSECEVRGARNCL